ncbi:MAG: DUF6569 family protein [Desulfobacterales bacterium]
MRQSILSYIERLQVGEPQRHENLVMVPLVSDYDDGLGYLPLAEAVAAGLFEIREVSEAGSVPELRVVNRGDKPVLILDGEELVGAKQNRIVNTTILVPADTELEIPVSCVEQGRWSYRGKSFETKKRVLNVGIRRLKAQTVHHSLRTCGTFAADQETIWSGVENTARMHEAVSASMDLDFVFEKKSPVLEKYALGLSPCERQLGAAFLAGGEVMGFDAFGRPGTLHAMFRGLVESYALDALSAKKEETPAATAQEKVSAFLAAAQSARVESRPSVGLGVDLRLETEKLTGFALEHEEKIVHFVLFPQVESEKHVELEFLVRQIRRRLRRV